MVEMISVRLLLACLLWAGAALFVFELLWYLLEKKLRLPTRLPPEFLEERGSGYFFSRYLIQLAFLVVLPSVAYSWFYVLVPFYGVRAGVSLALLLFMLGIIPYAATFFLKVKLPLAFTLFQMAGHLLKLLLVYGIISYLYIL